MTNEFPMTVVGSSTVPCQLVWQERKVEELVAKKSPPTPARLVRQVKQV